MNLIHGVQEWAQQQGCRDRKNLKSRTRAGTGGKVERKEDDG